MPIPTQTEMFHQVFSFMAKNPQEFRRSEVKERMALLLGLSNEEMKYLTNSGVPVYWSRIAWAISHLNEAGLLDRTRRGVYRISEKGQDVYSRGMDAKRFSIYLREARNGEVHELDASPVVDELSPVEEIARNVEVLNGQVGRELLDRILDKDPQFFEQLTVDLIEKMGYGKGSPTKYVADGGIDGIVATDSLGFDPIFIQAKRYDPNATVGRPEIQSFAGAMNEITRGVFITTAKYSKEATAFARAYKHATIKLVDGKELTRLMLKFNLGVANEQTFEIKRLDIDYFEED